MSDGQQRKCWADGETGEAIERAKERVASRMRSDPDWYEQPDLLIPQAIEMASDAGVSFTTIMEIVTEYVRRVRAEGFGNVWEYQCFLDGHGRPDR